MTRIVFILTSICLMVSLKINEFDCGEKICLSQVARLTGILDGEMFLHKTNKKAFTFTNRNKYFSVYIKEDRETLPIACNRNGKIQKILKTKKHTVDIYIFLTHCLSSRENERTQKF